MKIKEKKTVLEKAAETIEAAGKAKAAAKEVKVAHEADRPAEARAVQEPDELKKPEKKRKIWKTVLLLAVVYILVMAVITTAVDGRHVRFYLTGAETLTIECGEPFVDPGCYAVTVGRVFGETEQPLDIRVEGQVDSVHVGSYELRYVVNFLFREYATTRHINVIDTTAPEIELRTNEGYRPSWLDGYVEEGYIARDICDGDLTDKVQREVFEDRIVYTVADAAGNTASVERRPDYAVTAPEITLIGGEKLEFNACMYFKDPGFVALDSLGNDLSSYVHTEGEVTPYKPGTYEINYSISNALGETVSATRTVTIYSVGNPDTVQPDRNTIYLTFDDGPGPYTEWLLDILKAYNVKATFFVTCNNSDYRDMIGRAYREGHSIGVHSATHNYYDIYASEEAFFDDFNRAENMIYEQTGAYTSLLRFPGGSSNTVSNFNAGIMSRLSQAVADLGYQYYDWNVSSGDAGETTDTEKIVENIIDGCTGRRSSIVLQHDIKDYSVAAVEKVIIWGLNNGYTFSALNLTSPNAHHTVFN